MNEREHRQNMRTVDRTSLERVTGVRLSHWRRTSWMAALLMPLWFAPMVSRADAMTIRSSDTMASPLALRPARDADPARLQRVREIMDAAVDAKTRWREEWFSPEFLARYPSLPGLH